MPLMQRVSDLTANAVTVDAMLKHALSCKTAKPAQEAAA